MSLCRFSVFVDVFSWVITFRRCLFVGNYFWWFTFWWVIFWWFTFWWSTFSWITFWWLIFTWMKFRCFTFSWVIYSWITFSWVRFWWSTFKWVTFWWLIFSWMKFWWLILIVARIASLVCWKTLKMAGGGGGQVVSILKDALASIENVSTSTDNSSGSSTERQGTSRLPIRRPTSTVYGSLGIGVSRPGPNPRSIGLAGRSNSASEDFR